MKVIKIVLGSIVGLLALAGWLAVFIRVLNFDGSAFASGGLGGSVAISLLVSAGSLMLFKSAFKKAPNS